MNDQTTEYDPFDFADPDYAQRFYQLFDAYIDARVKGIPRDMAVIDAFELIRLRVSLHNVDQLGRAADANPYVKARFDKALAAKVVKSDLWTQNKAVHNLLKLIEDPRVRDTTRLNAINALNAMCGYLEMDEGMKRKIGHTLADFYAMKPQQQTH
ncbi:hypothetical protein [Paraburkholderia fungorum]|uniref:Uncharacterized protein n=1 Tax=Paraburkholderia fungorum TaxID=134537 RepID=A0AAW3UYK7_9BURK|nr:hypothetical protein [Paraburkholderia fungorum]MBB4515835.1 hypothetical protein [Paraburkholderia fungorum]MBB6203749.1 hypothetical protein [Paraburkholderia fungorum]